MPALTAVKLGIRQIQRHQLCGIVLQWNSNFLVHTFALIIDIYLSLYIILYLSPSVHLQTDHPIVTASTNNTSVDLRCTMTDYVRPIQWFKGDTLLESNPRYSFSVEFGEPDRVQSGQNRLGLSEIRVLTIADPQLSDSGTYTCRAQGTNELARVQLTISEGKTLSTLVYMILIPHRVTEPNYSSSPPLLS